MNYLNIEQEYILKEYSLNENENILENEQRICYILTKKNTVDIFRFIYESSRFNIDNINEIYDKNLLLDLKNEISKFDGFFY